MDTTVTPEIDINDAVETPAWELPDVDLPEPELSTAAWDGPLPDVDDHQPGGFPLGPIIGGTSLAAVIAGLGVFSAFGIAGLAVAGAATVAATPAAAIGVSDFRRRMKTGRWRPAGSRPAGQAGRMQRVATASAMRRTASGGGLSTRGGLFGGRPRAAAAGGRGGAHRALSGKSTGRGLFNRAGTTKASGKPPSPRTVKASAHPKTGPLSAGGSKSRHRRTSGRLGQMMRGLTGRNPSPAARRSKKPSIRPSGTQGGILGRLLPSARRQSARKNTLNAAGMSGIRGWNAARAQRRQSVRQQRQQRVAAARQRRWDRRDGRAAQRRKWWAKRRKVLRKSTRKTGRRALRRMAAFSSYPFRRCATGIRWAGARARNRFTAAWRRVAGSGVGRWAQSIRQINWGSLFLANMMRIREMVRSLIVRVPEWLGAPAKPAVVAQAPTKRRPPDAHDDERDSDAPAVTRPGRRPRPSMAVPAAAGKAPSVATPRSKRGKRMSGAVMHPAHEAAVEAFREAIGGWQPPDEGAYDEYEQFFASWQEMFEQMSEVVAGLGDRFRDETPLETAPEYLHEVAGGLTAMGEAGSELYESWRTGNAADIDRHENPRPNEKQLNVV